MKLIISKHSFPLYFGPQTPSIPSTPFPNHPRIIHNSFSHSQTHYRNTTQTNTHNIPRTRSLYSFNITHTHTHGNCLFRVVAGRSICHQKIVFHLATTAFVSYSFHQQFWFMNKDQLHIVWGDKIAKVEA